MKVGEIVGEIKVIEMKDKYNIPGASAGDWATWKLSDGVTVATDPQYDDDSWKKTRVKALAPGTATLEVTYGGKTATCTITVVAAE